MTTEEFYRTTHAERPLPRPFGANGAAGKGYQPALPVIARPPTRRAAVDLTDAHRAYAQIKERIITTALPPGSVIDVAGLMTTLDVGRTPIREALRLLEAEELVVISPRRVILVADVSLTDLRQLEEMRLALDSLCIRLAAQRHSPKQLAELRRLAAELDACLMAGNRDELLNLERRFHTLLREASHNRLLQTECGRLYDLAQRIWFMCPNRDRPAGLAESAFREVLAAIEARDAERADRAIRRHILYFGEVVRQFI